MDQVSSGVISVNLLVTTSLVAVISHAILQRHEPQITPALGTLAVSSISLPIVAKTVLGLSVAGSLVVSSVVAVTYFAVLFSCVAIWRLFLSPLNRFPGPTLAALSKLWYSIKLASPGRSMYTLGDLHKCYGDIVRVGPNELSICNVEAIPIIIGNKGNFSKGPFYDSAYTQGGCSLHAIRDVEEHSIRRRYWEKGMSGPAISLYQSHIKVMADVWIEILRKQSQGGSKPIDLSRSISLLAFDIMGQIGISKHYSALERDIDDPFFEFADKASRIMQPVGEIPWIMPILMMLAQGGEMKGILDFRIQETKERSKTQGLHDLFSYLIQENGQLYPGQRFGELVSDVSLLLIAGSDTTASALTFCVEFLSRHPSVMSQLREELKVWRNPPLNAEELSKLPVLNAVIHETLRVRPSVPTRVQRVVPEGGIFLLNQYIPGGTMVGIPQRAVMRDERYFSPDPEVWRPERWLHPEKETVLNKEAWFPFSVGPFRCVGKNLAMLELRTLLAQLVLSFDISPAQEHDAAKFERSILDYFAVKKGSFFANLKAL